MTLFTGAFYPTFGIKPLALKGGRHWFDLVEWISSLDSIDPHAMALSLTTRRLRDMGKLNHKLCEDPGCTICASKVLDQYDGSEEELLALYYKNLDELNRALGNMRVRSIEVEDVA